MPDMSQTIVRRSRVLGGVCVALACCWALAGFIFGWDNYVNYGTGPVPPPDSSFSLTALVINLSYSFAPLLLIALGYVYLSWAGRAGSWWLAGWTGMMAVCVMTSILTLLGDNALWPVIWNPSRLDFLAVSAGHLLAGAAMVAALVLAARRTRPAHGPGLLPSIGLGFAILLGGAIGFVVTGHVLYILALSWWLGIFHIGTALATRLRNLKQVPPEAI